MHALLPLVLSLAGLTAAPAQPQVRNAAATPVVSPYAPSARCPETAMSLARKKAEKPRLRRLDKLPDAGVFAAVDHRVHGCPAPVLLRATPRR